MDLVQHAIATFHEITLKGRNRGRFERVLLHNVRRALADLPLAEVAIPARVVVRFAEPVPWPAVHERLLTVFGINGVYPVVRVGGTYDELEAFVAANLDRWRGATFAVRCKRSEKRFPFSSEQVARRLGAFIQQRTGMVVDLSCPQVTFRVLLQSDGVYVYLGEHQGPGGLPVGMSGRVLGLLSGGIDSPVACHLMMKRGATVHFLHFHSAPYTADGSVQKAAELAARLARSQQGARLGVVRFGECQQEIVTRCPERLRVVLYRRMMLRVAERVARRWGCLALVTGEALNQVASQTLANIAAIDRVVHMPVLRPLIGADKQQSVDLAQRIGTFSTSVLPHADCCSFLEPLHPTTGTTHRQCDDAESILDVDTWVRRLQEDMVTERIAPEPWEHSWP